MKGFRKLHTRLLLLIILAGFSHVSKAQYVPTHLSNQGIYIFLDELASEHHIDLNSLVKPYGRMAIAGLLQEADSARSEMAPRMQAELDFYLKDYRKELDEPGQPAASWLWQKKNGNKRFDMFYYRDTLFQITVNPILGSDFWSNSNETFYHWWNGVEAWSMWGDSDSGHP